MIVDEKEHGISSKARTSKPVERNSIIGGVNGLEYNVQLKEGIPTFLTGRDLFLVNARSGIWLLVNKLSPPQVWIPSFLCNTIIEAIDTDRTVVRFYEIDYDLKIPLTHWISQVAPGDLVIFIDYFGFSYDRQFGALAKERGAWVLEDASQALLSTNIGKKDSDFVLFSLRKWIGVPDGGILRFPENFSMKGISLSAVPDLWWLKAFGAVLLRREFDGGVLNREWYKLFREAEDETPTGLYSMSNLSQAILKYSVDYSSIAKRRIDNYNILLESLQDYALFPVLETDVVPLGFPVRLRNRDFIRNALFENEIYPPVHWPINGIVPSKYKQSHRLSNEIMTIPCDQRYSFEDMKRVIDTFLYIAHNK